MTDTTVGTPTNQAASPRLPVTAMVYPAADIGAVGLDLTKTGVLEIVVPLNEFEKVKPDNLARFDAWPEAVRHAIEREYQRWRERHADAVETGRAFHTGTIASAVRPGKVPACIMQVFWTGPGVPKNTYTAEVNPQGGA